MSTFTSVQFTEEELAAKQVTTLPDRPTLSADEMKNRLDSSDIREKLNGLLPALDDALAQMQEATDEFQTLLDSRQTALESRQTALESETGTLGQTLAAAEQTLTQVQGAVGEKADKAATEAQLNQLSVFPRLDMACVIKSIQRFPNGERFFAFFLDTGRVFCGTASALQAALPDGVTPVWDQE